MTFPLCHCETAEGRRGNLATSTTLNRLGGAFCPHGSDVLYLICIKGGEPERDCRGFMKNYSAAAAKRHDYHPAPALTNPYIASSFAMSTPPALWS